MTELAIKISDRCIFIDDKTNFPLSNSTMNKHLLNTTGVAYYIARNLEIKDDILNLEIRKCDTSLPLGLIFQRNRNKERFQNIKGISITSNSNKTISLESSSHNNKSIVKHNHIDSKLSNTSRQNNDIPYRNSILKEDILLKKMEPKDQVIDIDKEIIIQWEEITFLDGQVSFEHKFKEVVQLIELKLNSSGFDKRYDSVKNYLAKFYPGQIKVHVKIKITNGNITIENIKSPLLESISSNHLEEIRINQTKDLYRSEKKKENNNLSLRSVEDLLKENKIGYTNPKDIIKQFTKASSNNKAVHYKHSLYLSSLHTSTKQKLHIILSTKISFLFYVQHKDKHFFIWETLNERLATYIWEVSDNIKGEFLRIKSIIENIANNGRESYKSTKELNFKTIRHEENDFNLWKNELENYIYS